jgi:L-malate glycosyltransferase
LATARGKALSARTFHKSLQNPLYAGWVTLPSDDTLDPVRGLHEPLVSQELSDDVQAVLAGRSPGAAPKRKLNPAFPLKHFVKCDSCGVPLTGGFCVGRSKRYAYYWCRNHQPHGDGLIAHGFINHLAARGHLLHVVAQEVDLLLPLPEGVTLHRVAPRFGGPLGRLEYMARMRRLFDRLRRQVKFDLIHQLNPVFVGLSLALAGSGLPLVLGTFVARWPADAEQGSRVSLRSRLKRLLVDEARSLIAGLQQDRANGLLLTTPAAFNRIPHADRVADRLFTLPHGIDTALFTPAADWDSDANLSREQVAPSILFFANVSRRKGIFTLLEAFAAVAREIPACRLTIAGDGPELPETMRRAAMLPGAQQIDFLGRLPRSHAPNLYRNATIYCLPSFGEPYATTVLEAMSCARPLVVTKAGGLPFMVEKQGGRHVPVDDPPALAQALVSLLSAPEERRVMGRFNRERVLNTMTWERVAEQLESIYQQVLA